MQQKMQEPTTMHETEANEDEVDAGEVLEADARNLLAAHLKDAFGPRCVTATPSCSTCRAWQAFDVVFGDEHDASQYVLDEMSWELDSLDDGDAFVASVTRETTKGFGDDASVTTLVADGALLVKGLASVDAEDAYAFLYRTEALFMLHTQRERLG